MTKVLITSGCSFTETVHPKSRLNGRSWADHLAIALGTEYQHVNVAQRSHGNGLISRSLIWAVTDALKNYNPKDILVGIMWSGPWRHDFFVDTTPAMKISDDAYVRNPTNFVDNSKGGWVICNHSWTNPVSTAYYNMFWSETGSLIYTLEHILRTQWFLERLGIKYFMSTHTQFVFVDPAQCQMPDTKYLYDQIDFSKFVPVKGEHEWVRETLDSSLKLHEHPSTEHHKQFCHQVVLPFIEKLQ